MATNTPNQVVHQAYKSDKRSWFALKHTHLSSYQPGLVHPDLVQPITGNTTVKLNMSRYIQSAPTVTPVFDTMRVNFRVFFYPQRLCVRGLYGNNFEEVDDIESIEIPQLSLIGNSNWDENMFGLVLRGSLLNRLGYPACASNNNGIIPLRRGAYDVMILESAPTPTLASLMDDSDLPTSFNASPLIAYYDIWNHYIRNPYVNFIPTLLNRRFRVQFDGTWTPIVNYVSDDIITNAVLGVRGVTSVAGTANILAPEDYYRTDDGNPDQVFFGGQIPLFDWMTDEITFGDNFFRLDSVLSSTGLLPSNFGEHYQTMYYDDEEIEKVLDIDLGSTVESLRLGKSVWNRALRTILRGRKFTDWIDVQFGSKLKMNDHPIFVGSDSMVVSFQDVLNQSSQGDTPLGKAAGAGIRGGKGHHTDRTITFTAQEPGYLMVLVDFVPEVSYSDALPRWAEYETMSSFPMPAYSGRTFQDLKLSDSSLLYSYGDEYNERVIGKQPLYFDYMSSYNRTSGLFATKPFDGYTFRRVFDLETLEYVSDIENYVGSTYILPTMFDTAFADVGVNGRQNIWMKTEYNLRLFQPLEKQVVTGRI